jgi:hypothetical protein
MKPINRKADKILGAPVGWESDRFGECAGLPVRMAEHGFISYWKPSIRERLAILFGRPVRLSTFSFSHPAVALDTERD